MDSPEYLAAMRALMEEEINYVFRRLSWQVTPEDTPDRHKDYLPLNLWDETRD